MSEDHTFGMSSWTTNISSNLYSQPPQFSQSFQERLAEYCNHKLSQNLRERFATKLPMEKYFEEKNQSLVNWHNEMRYNCSIQDPKFHEILATMCLYRPSQPDDMDWDVSQYFRVFVYRLLYLSIQETK